MTISLTQSQSLYAGNGTTTEFNVPFRFDDKTHISVSLFDANGAGTSLTTPADYVFEQGGLPSTDTITLTSAPASGETLLIKRINPDTQGLDLQTGGILDAEQMEGALDGLTMSAQELRNESAKSIKTHPTDTGGPVHITERTPNAMLKWDGTATLIEPGPSSADIATSVSNAAASAAAALAAQGSAESARDAALGAYSNFEDAYLGPFAADPTLDNDGSALEAGDLYYNTTDEIVKVYTGTGWVAAYVAASGSGALIDVNNLSDLADIPTAKTNLNLENVDNTADTDKPVSTAMQTALNGKASLSHNHPISDVTDLQTELDGKASDTTAAKTTLTNTFEKTQTGQMETVTFGANIALDFGTEPVKKITATGDFTFDAPTNITANAPYTIHILMDGTGGYTASYNTIFSFGEQDPFDTSSLGANEVVTLYLQSNHDGSKLHTLAFKEV